MSAAAVTSNGTAGHNGAGSGAGAGGQHLPTFLRLALMVRPWWKGVILNLIAALCNQASGVVLGVIGALLVARVAAGAKPSDLTPYIIALFGFVLAKATFTWLDMWLAHNLAYGMLSWLRSSSYNALEPLAPAYTLKRRGGDVVSMATSDVETIELFFAHTLIPAIVMLLVPTSLLIVLAFVAPPLALVLLPFIIGVAALPLLGRRWADPIATEVRGMHGLVNAHLVDSIQGMRELVSFGRGPARVQEVEEHSRSL